MGKSDDQIEETSAEKTSAEIAAEQWAQYQTDYRPFEAKWIADVTAPTATREAKVGGQVNADIAQKVGALPAPGVDPRRLANTADDPTAKISANAQALAGQKVKDQRLTGMQTVVDLGMGQKSDAQLSTEGLAANSVNKAISDASYDRSMNNAYVNGAMGALGAGAAIYKNWRTPAGNLTDFGTTEGQQAAISGADPANPDGYSFDRRTGNFFWNK